MKDEAQKMRDEINEIHSKMQSLFKEAEGIRKYYKYQCDETDSSSESFIVNFSTIIGDIYGLLCDLDEVIEWEQSQ